MTRTRSFLFSLQLPVAVFAFLIVVPTLWMASAAAADGPLPGEQVGPFRWARKLYDPAAPQPYAMCRNGETESAILRTGSTSQSGVVDLFQWSGDDQAGTRSFAGNLLAANPGAKCFVSLDDWDIQQGTDATGACVASNIRGLLLWS